MGSLAFAAAARAVWAITKDPDNPERRLFLPAKLNLARDPDGLAYRIDDGRVAWEFNPVKSTSIPSVSIRWNQRLFCTSVGSGGRVMTRTACAMASSAARPAVVVRGRPRHRTHAAASRCRARCRHRVPSRKLGLRTSRGRPARRCSHSCGRLVGAADFRATIARFIARFVVQVVDL